MLAIALGLGASIAWGSSDFLAGLRSRRHEILAVLLVSQVAGLVLVLAALAAVGGATPTPRQALFAMVAGSAELLGFAALYRGLAVGSMSMVAPLSAGAAVIPLVVGVFGRGEALGGAETVAVVLILAGVALGAGEPRSPDGRSVRLAAGAGLGLVAALGFGLFFASMGAAAGAGALVAVALNRATAIVLLLAAVGTLRRPSLRRPSRRITARDLGPLAAIGVLDALANVLFALALTRGLTGVVSVLGSLYPVTTVLLARLFLGERTTVVQRIGATACLAGVGAIAALGA